MTRALAFSLVTAGLLAASACGPKQFGSVCDGDNPPAECQTTCDPTPGAPNTCASGYHCAPDGTCNAQCTQGGGECGDGFTCTSDGKCVVVNGSGDPGPDANCPAVNFVAESVTPSIGLLLDQSGSMYDNQFGNVTRYQAMRDALVGANGVVPQLEAKAYFGSMLYTTTNCPDPIVSAVPRATNNAAAIRASIDSKLNQRGGNTPTHRAIDAMVASFQAAPPPAGSPPIIVLATDGVPNDCDSNNSTQPESVQAARNAYAAGLPVYVLAIDIVNQHFQDLANAGQGVMQGQPNAQVFAANDAASLAAAFNTIIGGVVSCDLTINGTIDESQAMNGTVTLNGQPLMYGTDWMLVDGNIIRLTGNACTQLKNTANPVVNASFPCGAVIL
jgi:hypothetical protein